MRPAFADVGPERPTGGADMTCPKLFTYTGTDIGLPSDRATSVALHIKRANARTLGNETQFCTSG
jgi:hypothetical protein